MAPVAPPGRRRCTLWGEECAFLLGAIPAGAPRCRDSHSSPRSQHLRLPGGAAGAMDAPAPSCQHTDRQGAGADADGRAQAKQDSQKWLRESLDRAEQQVQV